MTAKSYKGLVKQFQALPEGTKAYLKGLDPLISEPATYPVALAFSFMKLEEGNHRALKCGLIRIHKCNSRKVDEALLKQHFTRPYFRTVFKNVFGKEVKDEVLVPVQAAEKVRDKLIHGKRPSESDLRSGIANALDYIDGLGSFVESETNKNPFGDLRGLAGKSPLLDSVPSFWLLKGLGFFNDKSSNS